MVVGGSNPVIKATRGHSYTSSDLEPEVGDEDAT